jgi:hypothetical protein
VEKSRSDPAEKNEKRVSRWMWLMVPEVERPNTHRELNSIDFVECRRMGEEVKGESR